MTGISLDWYGEKKTWLLTAYEKEGSKTSTTMNTAGKSEGVARPLLLQVQVWPSQTPRTCQGQDRGQRLSGVNELSGS